MINKENVYFNESYWWLNSLRGLCDPKWDRDCTGLSGFCRGTGMGSIVGARQLIREQ
jgi:hypothetical protein